MPITSTAVIAADGVKKRKDVQGLRALAILLVVAFHAGLPVPGGFMGVDVFFAISGFVITTTLVAELQRTGRLSLGRFYLRRARRLLPALAVMLTFVLAAAALVSPLVAQRMTAFTGATASFFASNGYLLSLGHGYFDVDADLNPLLHTWTLAVEEQFYLFFPVVLLLSWRFVAKRAPGAERAVAAVCIGSVSAVSLLLALLFWGGWLHGFGSPEQTAFYASPLRAWEFGAGALVALASPRLSRGVVAVASILAVAALAAAAFTSQDVWEVRGTVLLLPVLGTCALILVGGTRAILATRALSTRPLVWIGDLSYSWYLWHWPLIVFAKALWPGAGAAPFLAALASLAPAWLSLRFVENPIRFGVALPGRAFGPAAVACLLVPVAAAGGLLGVRSALAADPTMRSWIRSQALHEDVRSGCDRPYGLSEREGGTCIWTVSRPRGDIVLVGDSNAGQYAEPVVRAGRGAGYNVQIVTFSSCPFVDAGVLRAAAYRGEALCRRFAADTLEELVHQRPSLVITASRADEYIENDSIRLRAPSGRLAHTAAEKSRVWEGALERTLSRLARADIPVLLVHALPRFHKTAGTCTVLELAATGCASEISRSSADRELARAERAQSRAVRAVAGTIAVDFENAFCGARTCSTSRGSTILFRDGEHLSVDGALTLTDSFYRLIQDAVRR